MGTRVSYPTYRGRDEKGTSNTREVYIHDTSDTYIHAYILWTHCHISCIVSSAAGPHTMINGKEVVNFTSANYLGLMGHEKLLVRKYPFILFSCGFTREF